MDAKRAVEAELMALLDGIVVAAEEAQSYVQDDSKISGPNDVQEIRARLMRVRALSLEADKLLSPLKTGRRS